MSTENETQSGAEGATIDASTIVIGGSISTPNGMHPSVIIDPVVITNPPRYRLWDGAHHYDEIESHWSRESAVAMARGLAAVSRNTVRLVEITEVATEIQFDQEATR